MLVPTSAEDAVAELLARIGAAGGAAVEVTAAELDRWPQGAVSAFKAGRLLMPAKPGDTAICPGCERACAMPIHWAARGASWPAPFVVCDKRDDISRVPLDGGLVERWRSGEVTLADALATLLARAESAAVPQGAEGRRLGVVAGGGGRRAVHLRVENRRCILAVAGHRVDVELVLVVSGGRLALDTRPLARCAANPAIGATNAETPQMRTARLAARKAELLSQGERTFIKRIATEEGLSESMVKRILARADKDVAPTDGADELPGWAQGILLPNARPSKSR
jgi:hypothetical protein